MAANFKSLLNKPSGEAIKPQPLPVADYPGIIKDHELGESPKKKTPFVRFFLGLTDWPDSVPEEQRVFHTKDGKTHRIDLSKKQFKIDFYLTDDSLYRLDDLFKSLNLAPGRSYEELIPECHGMAVLVAVRQENTTGDGDEVVTYNTADKIVGLT